MIAMLEFMCPNCRSRLGLDDRFAGKRARCPKCAEVVAVPGFSLPPAVPEAQLADEPLVPGLTEIGAEIGRAGGEIGRTIGQYESRIGEAAREERDALKSGLQAATEKAKSFARDEVRDAKAAVGQAMRQREDALKQQIAAAKERAKERVQQKVKVSAPAALRTCFGCVVVLAVIGAFLGVGYFRFAERQWAEVDREEQERQMREADEDSPDGPEVQLRQETGPLTKEDDRVIGELFRRLSHPRQDMREGAVQRIHTLIRRDRFGMLDRLKTEFETNDEGLFVRTAGELLLTQFGEEGSDFVVELSSSHSDQILYISHLVEAAEAQPDADQVRRTLQRMEQATRGGKAHGTVVAAIERAQ